MSIDIHTLSLIAGLGSFLQVLAISLQYKVNRRIPGISWWLFCFISIALGYAFSLLREFSSNIPLTVVATNILFVSGLMFQYIGTMKFLGKPEKQRTIFIIFTVFLPLCLYFTYIQDDLAIRSMIISVTIAIYSFLTAHAFFFFKTRSISVSANFNALITLVHSCFYLFRTIVIGMTYPMSDYFDPTLTQTMTFLISFITNTLFISGLIIMINQRSGEESREARERFQTIFNTSPDAVLIIRLQDNCFADINEGFTAITGITREEIIGETSLSLNMWHDPNDYQRFVTILREEGSIENMEVSFFRKNNNQFTGLVSAKTIVLDGLAHGIAIIRDITDRKLIEKEREKLIFELKEALSQVKTLSGLLPICASCKRIRNADGRWEQLEEYISGHSDVDFSHGICPECRKKLYPEYSRKT